MKGEETLTNRKAAFNSSANDIPVQRIAPENPNLVNGRKIWWLLDVVNIRIVSFRCTTPADLESEPGTKQLIGAINIPIG